MSSFSLGTLARRQFLRIAAATGTATIAARSAQAAMPATVEQGRKVGAPLRPYGQPSPYEKVVRVSTTSTPTQISSWDFTPLQHLHGIVTPNGLFYERNHAGIPNIDPRTHRLLVYGLVDGARAFTIDDLLRYPAVSVIRFLECSGNTLTEWKKPTAKTVQVSHGLVSCCEWTGVSVKTLLQDIGVDSKARWVVAEGADAGLMDRSIPLEKMMDDAILAYAQNGERLRPEQGYPLRLLLPGFEGNMSIKWLRGLKLTTEPTYSREETSKYTDLLANGKARAFTFVMDPKSVITSPSGGMVVENKGFNEIRGLAWSGRGKIRRVDVSTDGGAKWNEAALQEPVLEKCLTRFRFPWTWAGGSAVLQSRCVDETGYVQPTLQELVRVRGTDSVYHNNGIQSWAVASDGAITNVQA